MTEPINALKIPLTKGKFALIDKEDYPKVNNYRWTISKLGYPQAILNSYKSGQKKNKIEKTLYLHQLLLNFPNSSIDHIDNNPLNNRKNNLRLCTQKENTRNQKIKKNNTSGYKGVSWSKAMNKWESRINPDDKAIILGYFITKEEAAKAYDKGAIRYFGEFARTNF